MNPNEAEPKPRSAVRMSIVAAIVLLLVGYTLLVLTGTISKEERIDSVHFILLVAGTSLVAVILRPDVAARLRLLEVKGFRIELLERMQERQMRVENVVEDIRLIIPLLFRDEERRHLSNLVRGKTAGYRGGGDLREQLRRLCSIGLLERRPGHKIGDLHSAMTFDLGDHVQITELGRRWARKLAEIEDSASDQSNPKEQS